MPWVLASLPHHCANPECLFAFPKARAGTRVGPGAARSRVTITPCCFYTLRVALCWAGLPHGLRWSDAWGKSPRSEVPLPKAPSTWQEGTAEFCFSRLVSRRVHKCFYVPGKLPIPLVEKNTLSAISSVIWPLEKLPKKKNLPRLPFFLLMNSTSFCAK